VDTRTLGVSARLAWFLSATKQLVCAEVEDLEPFELVIEQFKRSVEEQGGWRLLWNDGNVNEKPEEAAQLLFKGIAQSYCHANDIVIDREPNLGRGPVDFKFSNGYQRRALLEVKKLSTADSGTVSPSRSKPSTSTLRKSTGPATWSATELAYLFPVNVSHGSPSRSWAVSSAEHSRSEPGAVNSLGGARRPLMSARDPKRMPRDTEPETR